MPSYRYAHVHINVVDMDTSIAFYQHMFGAKLLSRAENLPGRTSAALDLNGMRIILSDKLYPLDAPILPGCVEPHLGLEHFALMVDDFDAAMADLRAKGAEFLMEPHEFRPGSWIAFVKAPDDVRIEIVGQ
ncbi:MAG: VOC family protein [Chloroflexi bacterium]|nr:VOC family protein [Chloroflexota bacterium]